VSTDPQKGKNKKSGNRAAIHMIPSSFGSLKGSECQEHLSGSLCGRRLPWQLWQRETVCQEVKEGSSG